MKRQFIALAASILCLASCNSFLERTPKSTMAPENYFRDETDLQLFSNSFYNNLLDKTPYNEQSDQLVYLNLSAVMRGGNNRTVPNSGGGWGNGSGAWGDLRKMNTLLEYIERCEDEAAVLQYTALTRFFRAYLYFTMVQRFGDRHHADGFRLRGRHHPHPDPRPAFRTHPTVRRPAHHPGPLGRRARL